MMNVITCNSEVSGHYKQIDGPNAFYSFPRDLETLLRKGMNSIHALAEIG